MTTALPNSEDRPLAGRGHKGVSEPMDPEIFARGSTVRRRWVWTGFGLTLLALAGLDGLLGAVIPAIEPATTPLGIGLAVCGAIALFLGVGRRSRGYEITRRGVVILTGNRVFGDRQLLPWASLTRFGGRRVGEDAVRLIYVQQHVNRICPLRGPTMSVAGYDQLIDRLRVVLGDRYRQLMLGGLEG